MFFQAGFAPTFSQDAELPPPIQNYALLLRQVGGKR